MKVEGLEVRLLVAIVTSHLTKKYGDLVAVRNLHLEVKSGEVFGFLGIISLRGYSLEAQ